MELLSPDSTLDLLPYYTVTFCDASDLNHQHTARYDLSTGEKGFKAFCSECSEKLYGEKVQYKICSDSGVLYRPVMLQHGVVFQMSATIEVTVNSPFLPGGGKQYMLSLGRGHDSLVEQLNKGVYADCTTWCLPHRSFAIKVAGAEADDPPVTEVDLKDGAVLEVATPLTGWNIVPVVALLGAIPGAVVGGKKGKQTEGKRPKKQPSKRRGR